MDDKKEKDRLDELVNLFTDENKKSPDLDELIEMDELIIKLTEPSSEC